MWIGFFWLTIGTSGKLLYVVMNVRVPRKTEKFLDQLIDCQLLKKDRAPRLREVFLVRLMLACYLLERMRKTEKDFVRF